MIAVATSCGVARTGGTFAVASGLCGEILVLPDEETGSPHAAPHGGSVVTSVGFDVDEGTARVVETLPSFISWCAKELVVSNILHWHEGWLQNHGRVWETPDFFSQIHIAHVP